MTNRQLQIEFERRVQLINPELLLTSKLNSDTIFSFINEAIDKFYKTRYSGLNTHRTGFEQTQKRIDDLRTLIVTETYDSDAITTTGNGKYIIDLPYDYVLLLGDTAGIIPTETNICWEKDKTTDQYVIKKADTIEATIETIDKQLNNSLSEHNLKYCEARPLRLIQGNEIQLFTDGKYKVTEYTLTYLSQPQKINPSNITNDEYTGLPQHTHMEIVKMAVQLYLATTSNNENNSYSVYSAEVNSME